MKSLKNIHLLVVIAGVFSLTSASAQQADAEAELQNVRQKVNAMFQAIAPEDVTPSPLEGWYTIHRGSIVAYVSSDARYLIQGDLIDLDANVNLSEYVRNSSRRELMASVSDEEVIAFSPSEVKYSIDVFTDVDCTYCRRLHSQIDEYLAYGIEIRYLMYPRNGPSSPAWTTAEEVWCSNDRNSALTAAKADRKFASTNCDASAIAQQYDLGQEVGLTGTPAMVLDDGTLISGYLPPDQLKARLDVLAAGQPE
ncbi:MAG: thioredoxin fold domain-containing protein [Woeseiaceae bacterium]